MAKTLPYVTATEMKRAKARSKAAKKQLAKLMPFEQWCARMKPTESDIELYRLVENSFKRMASDPMECIQEFRSAPVKKRRGVTKKTIRK